MASGRPFPKGKSGNPGGRPKAAANLLAKKWREETGDGDEIMKFVLRVMRGQEPDLMDAKSRRWAADVALDRGWGRPQVHIELTSADGPPAVDYSVLNDAELAELERITAKLQLAAATIEAAGDGGDSPVH